MWRFFATRFDVFVPAMATIGIGAFIILQSRTYQMGTLRDMGPGYFPSLLGVILCLLGLCLPFTAKPGTGHDSEEISNLRGPLLIVAAILTFAATVETLGLIPAVFAAAFLSSRATRGVRFVSSLLLAAFTAASSYMLFVVLLKLQMQAFG